MTDRHPTSEEIDLFALGADEEIHFPNIASHLADCDRCAQLLVKEARLDLALGEIAESVRFCPGCNRINASDRCDHCGVAHAPGGFVVEHILVQTAHGRLYLARDPDGRQVALKELVFTQIPNSQVLIAFEKEAKLLQQLEHPGVPRFVASFSEGEGVHTRLYLAQEFVEGSSLLSRLGVHRFTEAEAIDIARRVLEILEYLHGLNPKIIHRDIKPANILQRRDGSIVLVDFGSARDFSMTGGATLVGTFGYIPPEQLVGMADETSDLYGLGASLAHLLTRRPPWQLTQRRRELGDLNVSPVLRKFIAKLMAEDPRERFPSAAEAKRALERPTIIRRFRWQRPLMALAAAAIVAGSTVAGVKIGRSPRHQPKTEATTKIAGSPRQQRTPKEEAPAEIVRPPKPEQPSRRQVGIGTAAFAQSGSILVASSPESSPKHLLFRIDGGEWTAIEQLAPRREHTATLLNDELVLLAGGRSLRGKALDSAEVCSLTAGSCRRVDDMDEAHAGHTATLLRNGSVLIVGEKGSEIFVPSSEKNHWVKQQPKQTHFGHTATLLSDGRVLVIGPEAEIFNPKDGSWTTVVQAGPPRIEHTASLLADGTVLIAGGASPDGNEWVRELNLFVPLSDAAYDMGMVPRPRRKAVAWADSERRVVLVGGHTIDGVAAQIDLYEDMAWREIATTALSARVGFAIQPVSADRVRLIGGVRLPEERLADLDVVLPPRLLGDPRRRAKRVSVPRNPTAKLLADDAYRALASGRLNDAKDILTNCVSAFPTAAQCYRLLGSVYAEIDDTRMSILHYKQYLKLKPSAPDAERVKSLIRGAEAETNMR